MGFAPERPDANSLQPDRMVPPDVFLELHEDTLEAHEA